MNEYIFILKNEKTGSYKKSIYSIIGLNFIFLIYLAISFDNYKTRITAILSIGFIIVSFLIKYFLGKRDKKFSAVFTSLGFIILVYFKLNMWWQAAAMSCILLFYFYSIRNLRVYISKKDILYPSFPSKRIKWESINNLLLKDNLLTIDFKNNKLIQSEVIANKKDGEADEIEFNDFCKRQINK